MGAHVIESALDADSQRYAFRARRLTQGPGTGELVAKVLEDTQNNTV